jgi:hypothetical protein
MNKRDWTWFVIRVFGLYLLIDAVRALPRVISSAYSLVNSYFIPVIPDHGDVSHTLHTAYDTLHKTMDTILITSVTEVIIYTSAGIYLLRGGAFIFKLVCPPDEHTEV